jgi:hypothetical protein
MNSAVISNERARENGNFNAELAKVEVKIEEAVSKGLFEVAVDLPPCYKNAVKRELEELGYIVSLVYSGNYPTDKLNIEW